MSEQSVGIKVSVVIPTKNAGPILKDVLDAVFVQQTDWPYEVVIVDSGSSDGTVELIKKYSSIRLIEISPNEFGHGRTRNFAVSKSSGEFVAMITQDALPMHNKWLSSLVDTMESDPCIAGVFGRHIAYPDANPFTKEELVEHFKGFLTKPVVELDDPDRYKVDEGYRQFLYFFSDNNALLRKSVWEEINYPEVDFAEDQAWARLIIEAGYKKAYSDDAVVSHSHDYGLLERLQRSFDEAFALRRLFNYQYGQGLKYAIRGFLALTFRDFRFALNNGVFKTGVFIVALMPVDNFMRVIGQYLGAKGNRLPEFLRMKLSRDRKLMMVSMAKNSR